MNNKNDRMFFNSYYKRTNVKRTDIVKELNEKYNISLNGQTKSILNNLRSINDKNIRNEILIFLLKYRTTVFSHLVDINEITDDEIVGLCKIDEEVFLCLPISFYNKHPELIDMLAESKNPDLFDYLPMEIRQMDKIKESFNRNKKIYSNDGYDLDGYDKNWISRDGKFRKYFDLLGDFEIKTKDDYLKIVKAFTQEKITIPEFCQKYGINSVEGFKKLLDRIKEENLDVDLSEEVSEINKQNQKKFYATINDIAKDLANGTITLEQYFAEYYKSSHRFNHLLTFGFSDNKEKLFELFENYIKSHDYNLEIKKIMDLFQSENMINLADTFLKEIKINKLNNPNLVRDGHECQKIIKRYSKNYTRTMTYKTIIVDNKEYNIDDNIIDQSLAYISDNDLYKCQYVVDKVSRKIALGEINYDEEMNSNKEKMKDAIMKEKLKLDMIREMISKQGTIEDYIDIIQETQQGGPKM